VDVVAFGRLLTHQVVETGVATTDLTILDGLIDVVVRIALSNIFGELYNYLLIFTGHCFGLFIVSHGGNWGDNLGYNLWNNFSGNWGNLGSYWGDNLSDNLGHNLRDNLRDNFGDDFRNNFLCGRLLIFFTHSIIFKFV
jgi:hypothetical protein